MPNLKKSWGTAAALSLTLMAGSAFQGAEAHGYGGRYGCNANPWACGTGWRPHGHHHYYGPRYISPGADLGYRAGAIIIDRTLGTIFSPPPRTVIIIDENRAQSFPRSACQPYRTQSGKQFYGQQQGNAIVPCIPR